MHYSTYLNPEEQKKFKQRASFLQMSEGELTKKLIHFYLNTPIDMADPDFVKLLEICPKCRYYQMSQSGLFLAFSLFKSPQFNRLDGPNARVPRQFQE